MFRNKHEFDDGGLVWTTNRLRDTQTTGFRFSPIVFPDSNANLKRSHDEYHVYVNGDLVGNKVLLTQVDDVHDVAAYLRRHGFHDFKTNLDGDHYTVEMNEASQVEAVKRQLSTYLQIR